MWQFVFFLYEYVDCTREAILHRKWSTGNNAKLKIWGSLVPQHQFRTISTIVFYSNAISKIEFVFVWMHILFICIMCTFVCACVSFFVYFRRRMWYICFQVFQRRFASMADGPDARPARTAAPNTTGAMCRCANNIQKHDHRITRWPRSNRTI